MDRLISQPDLDPRPAAWRRVTAACSIIALVWLLVARMTGPSDAWDQAQPYTTSYTTDILVNGRWVLPQRPGGYPATKPPLYNWLAAPAVRLMGFSAEAAHRAPSIVALCLCWLVTVGIGRRLEDRWLGWTAGTCLAANYTIFKLGYLARPDMLLTLWLVLGWGAATAVLAGLGKKAPLTLAFWCCVGLAALTKGPAALVLLVYALVAARVVGGRFRAAGALGWWWGLPLALAIFGAWVWGAWRVDPEYVRDELWGNQVVGRITGRGTVGSGLGPIGVLTTAPYMVLYYVGFFAPWSLCSVAAVVVLWRRVGGSRRWRSLGPRGAVLWGAAIFIFVNLAFYTLSASKRADYLAAAYVPGALLAAWWLSAAPPRLGRAAPWLVPATVIAVLSIHTAVMRLEPNAPQRGFGDAINRFIADAETHLRAEPAPTAFWVVDSSHLQSYLGLTAKDDRASVERLIEAGRPFWLFAGAPDDPAQVVRELLRRTRSGATMTEACRSEYLTWNQHWPGKVTLYRVDPGQPGEQPDEDSRDPSA